MARTYTLSLRAAFIFLCIVSPPANGQVTVDKSFDADGKNGLQVIANEVWGIVRDLFGRDPPLNLPIHCYFKPDYPQTRLDDWLQPTTILIGINITESKWDQFAYQFAHELGHVMLSPRRTNGIIETICMALAYETLDRLYAKWGSGIYSNGILTAYAPHFRSYRERDQTLTLSRFPPEIKEAVERKNWRLLRIYFQKHRSEQEQLTQAEIDAQHGRDLETLGAIALRSEPIPWKELWNLGACTKPTPDAMPVLRLLPINPECIQRLSPTLCRIGRGCTSRPR
jgi:hypothetical protein